jgi:CRISPR-associated protein Cst2
LIPAPTISALNPEYKREIEKITENLNRIAPDAIEIKEFDGLGALSTIIADLIKEEPYKIQ